MDLIERASSMEIQQKHIPQLRFPEFKNDENWEVAKVGDVIKTITPPKKLNSSEYKKTGKYPIIDQSQSYICGYSDDDDALMNHNNEDLIVFGDHTCVLKFVSFPFIQGADGIKIIKSKDSNKLVESFLFQSLQNNPVVSREYKRHFSELKEKEFCFSNRIAEQRKIASCLFSMDAYISATKEKLELLKTYKKGLMQKIFPAKGKKQPQLRFKEFEKDGEWEVKKLGEITTDIYQPQTISQSQFSADGYPVYGANGIIGYYEFYNHDTDQILVTCRGSSCGTINYSVGKCWITGNAMVINLDSVQDCYDKRFVYYMLLNKDLSKLITGSGQPQIVRAPLLNLEVNITNSIYEQRRIADCFDLIDEMINQYTNKVAVLELYKKGLMQQMFPTSK